MLSFAEILIEAVTSSKVVFKKTIMVNGKRTVLTFTRDRKTNKINIDKINNRKLTKTEQEYIMSGNDPKKGK